MTNFQYIISKMKDVDFAAIFMNAYENVKNPLLESIDVAFWNWLKSNSNKSLNINCQIWLSLPYRPEEWEEEN